MTAPFQINLLGVPGICFRNRLRNPSLGINQRAVAGTVTLAAGVHGHDGVKAGAAGATYTFVTTGLDTTLTVSAGSLIMPIEGALIEGGTYMLSHAGTAQARVWQGTGYTGSGAYASIPLITYTLTVGVQTNVEFGVGTILCPQFEPGNTVTPFERRPYDVEYLLCYRYYYSTTSTTANGFPMQGYALAIGSRIYTTYKLPAAMYVAPTVALVGTWSVSNCALGVYPTFNTSHICIYAQATVATVVIAASAAIGVGFSASAELA